jgi:hypothetical protein
MDSTNREILKLHCRQDQLKDKEEMMGMETKEAKGDKEVIEMDNTDKEEAEGPDRETKEAKVDSEEEEEEETEVEEEEEEKIETEAIVNKVKK